MNRSETCRYCGCEVSDTALGGQCPRCLLEAGLEQLSQTETGAVWKSSGPRVRKRFAPPAVERIAHLFPRIEILELLGEGGMGAVYKGRHTTLDRLVAVKILPPDLGESTGFSERFGREARSLARLNHPSIVAVHDFGQVEGLYYFVMEYVDGANLRHLIRERAIEPVDALGIVSQICDALQFAHDEGIMHRDIKPENILISKKGRVKIADFGLAKLLEHNELDDHLTDSHQVMGTVKYMAPEQIEGARNIDHRADIYSLGVVFYELLTGELPLGRFAPPSRKVQIDVRLDEIVLRALEKEPERRYQQVSAVKSEVESVIRTPPGVQTASTTTGKRPVQSGEHSVFRIMQNIVAATDELDRPYVQWVVLPTIALASFWCLLSALSDQNSPKNFVLVGLFPLIVAFVLATATAYLVSLIRRRGGYAQESAGTSWTPERTARHIRVLSRLFTLSGWLTIAFWLAISPLLDEALLWIAAAITVGLIIASAGRSLAEGRSPRTFALFLATLPFSPASMLSLPAALITLRALVRPETQAYFHSRSSAKEVVSDWS